MSENEATNNNTIDALVARDANFDLGNSLTNTFQLYKANFGMIFGASLLVWVLAMLLQIPSNIGQAMMNLGGMSTHQEPNMGVIAIGSFLILISLVLSAVFTGPLYGGLLMFLLRIKRGENPDFGRVFDGFRTSFVQLMLVGIVSTVLVTIGFLLCFLPGIYLAVGYIFMFLLIMDKGLNFWDALEVSRKVVTKNWFLFFAYLLVSIVLAMLGVIACIIGVIVTMPFVWVAIVSVYDEVFGDAPSPALETGG